MSRKGRPSDRMPRSPSLAKNSSCQQRPLSLDIFRGVLDSTSMAEFASLGLTGYAEPGQCLFHEGDSAEVIYNVVRGTLKLYRLFPDGRRQIARFVHSRDILGLTVQRTQGYTAEALEPVEYCRFPRERFDRFVAEHPKLARELYTVVVNELAAARELVIVLGRKTARERVASFLVEQFDRARSRGDDRESIHLPMTRTDVGDYLGLTKETVSRRFTKLREARLITLLPDDRVELLDRVRLERLARGEGG